MHRVTPAVACVVWMLVTAGLPALGEPSGHTPWWDNFPTVVQVNESSQATSLHATAALCGPADDQSWGIWGQRLRTLESGKRTCDAMHAAGVKALTYVEGFGNAVCFVVQLKKNPDGSWVKAPGTDVTEAFRNAWSWKSFDGTGQVRWVGIHDYWDNLDYARPYTYLNPRYGAPPLTYPDGRPATGYNGPATDPRNSRVFDASCSKNVLGQLWGSSAGKLLITDVLRGNSRPGVAAPANPGNAPTIVPDPGYTPAEWADHTRKTGALTIFQADKDSTCPFWIDYARAEVRLALDNGVDGMWVDNYSPWDSFNAHPIDHAFGEWAVARFRTYLKKHFSKVVLAGMGVTDLHTFDVRQYLQARVRAWGGNPQNLKDPRWADIRWQDDPLWRAYIIFRRQAGTQELTGMYRAIKQEGARAGKPDFLVMGNDIPGFSLGWPRGDLDMVSTELTWGWWIGGGPRGIMPPPYGCFVPVYKLAREHARSRFVNVWMYAADDAKNKPEIADILDYQGLATHTLPMPQLTDKTIGTHASNAAFFKFVRSVAPVFGARRPIEQVGLYYSSSSLLEDMLPAGVRDFSNQVHMFSFWGWGTALTWLHVPWRAAPEWKLTPEFLRGLRALIIPNADVFPASSVPVLEKWVRGGGRLIISGNCGLRRGEAHNFDRCATGTTLASLEGSGPDARPTLSGAEPRPAPRAIGDGRVLYLAQDPGLPFYQADKARPGLLPQFERALNAVGTGPNALFLTAPEVSWKVGLTPYSDPGRLFVDVNNTDIDLATDTITPAPAISFTVTLPDDLKGKKLSVKVVSPDMPSPSVQVSAAGKDRLAVKLGPVRVYASVVVGVARQ